MLDYITDILRDYPALALFLTVGLGFVVGRIRIGHFSLGSVTSVLIIGVIVGQLDIPMSGPLKTVFFMMFLFSIGYSVGPNFFKSLRGQGLKQVIFAVLMSLMCFGATLLMAHIMSYTKGETVGLFAGSQTCSSLIGVGSEAISKLPLPDAVKNKEIDIIPVCYAVTYIFGTLGTVILLGNFGPKLLGGLDKVKRETAALEETMSDNAWLKDPANFNVRRPVSFRAYRLTANYFCIPHTVAEAESYLLRHGIPVYIGRVCHDGEILTPDPSYILRPGDEVVLCGRLHFMLRINNVVGPEVDNPELLTYPVHRIPVRIASTSEFVGKPLHNVIVAPFMRAVSVRDIERGGSHLRFDPTMELRKGDILTIVGSQDAVSEAVPKLGHAERPTTASDIMFMGLAIFIGGFLGALSFWIEGVPVSLGTSGGALVAGIIFGWLRSKRPSIGYIPPAALWLMNNLGLNVFIAVVGIEAAPSFFSGLQSIGWMLFVVGAVCTTIPLLFGLWLGHKVFRFPAAITLGCCAGTRTCTASLGAVQDTIGSTIPAMAYTVTYAVSNLLLVIWGMMTVALV
ncbi:MAG: aspartate-alanine antiporter [Duncaniella sp.]|nr:aspartate-alanine antiporter [Duncaniella sp.]